MGIATNPRFVTGTLKVVYLAPTPLGFELELRGVIIEIKERKIIVDITLSANGKVCAKGEVFAVMIPENMIPDC